MKGLMALGCQKHAGLGKAPHPGLTLRMATTTHDIQSVSHQMVQQACSLTGNSIITNQSTIIYVSNTDVDITKLPNIAWPNELVHRCATDLTLAKLGSSHMPKRSLVLHRLSVRTLYIQLQRHQHNQHTWKTFISTIFLSRFVRN